MCPPLPHALQFFNALNSRSRCRILTRLFDALQTVSSLARTLRLRQSDVSNHLAVLRQAGIVSTSRHGRFVFYQLDEQFVQLIEVLWDALELASDPTLAADAWQASGAR